MIDDIAARFENVLKFVWSLMIYIFWNILNYCAFSTMKNGSWRLSKRNERWQDLTIQLYNSSGTVRLILTNFSTNWYEQNLGIRKCFQTKTRNLSYQSEGIIPIPILDCDRAWLKRSSFCFPWRTTLKLVYPILVTCNTPFSTKK